MSIRQRAVSYTACDKCDATVLADQESALRFLGWLPMDRGLHLCPECKVGSS